MFSIKVNKAQISHRHATDAPPTHVVRYKFKEWSTRRPTVGRLSVDCRPSTDCRSTVDRLSVDCRSTRWPTCWPTRRWDRILYLYPSTSTWVCRPLRELDPFRSYISVQGFILVTCSKHFMHCSHSLFKHLWLHLAALVACKT